MSKWMRAGAASMCSRASHSSARSAVGMPRRAYTRASSASPLSATCRKSHRRPAAHTAHPRAQRMSQLRKLVVGLIVHPGLAPMNGGARRSTAPACGPPGGPQTRRTAHPRSGTGTAAACGPTPVSQALRPSLTHAPQRTSGGTRQRLEVRVGDGLDGGEQLGLGVQASLLEPHCAASDSGRHRRTCRLGTSRSTCRASPWQGQPAAARAPARTPCSSRSVVRTRWQTTCSAAGPERRNMRARTAAAAM